jgi:hypothetical protein
VGVGVGKPRSALGDGAKVAELVDATVPVGATEGATLGEGLVATESIGAAVPKGVTCGAVVGVGVVTGVDVAVPADGMDKVIDMDMVPSSRKAL